jgi:hypothetical protein
MKIRVLVTLVKSCIGGYDRKKISGQTENCALQPMKMGSKSEKYEFW